VIVASLIAAVLLGLFDVLWQFSPTRSRTRRCEGYPDDGREGDREDRQEVVRGPHVLGLREQGEESLEEKIKQNALDEYFGDILIPMENVVEMVKGEKRARSASSSRYILVQMELNDRTWHLVKNTPKITGFVGNATRPPR